MVCFWQALHGGYYQHGFSVPPFLLKYIGVVLLLFGLLCFKYLKKAQSTENWLIKLYNTKLQIKFRTYLNAHFDKTVPVVVEIPMREISWCRKTEETIASPRGYGSNNRTFHIYLDIKLCSVDLQTLQNAILEEFKRKAPISERVLLRRELFQARKNKSSAAKIDAIKKSLRTKEIKSQEKQQAGMCLHYPVRLIDNGILRLEWNSIYPRINNILEKLGKIKTVEPVLKINSTELNKLSGKQLEDRILLLAQRGDVIRAVQLVRQKYNKSLKEAKKFVDELSG